MDNAEHGEQATLTSQGNLLSTICPMFSLQKILSWGLRTHGYFKYKQGDNASTHLHDLWITSELDLNIGKCRAAHHAGGCFCADPPPQPAKHRAHDLR